MSKRLVVDRTLCDTQAMCVSIAPDHFAVDDDDETMQILIERPAAADLERVERAVRACPKGALSLVDD